MAKWASCDVVLRFGVPAIVAALFGASLMALMSPAQPLARDRLGAIEGEITPLKLVITVVLLLFALLEVSPRWRAVSFPKCLLPVGGLLSGFCGGISGLQGAIRAPFLLRAGLPRDQYVGTTNVISTLLDLTPLIVYMVGLPWLAGSARSYGLLHEARTRWLLAAACRAAFCGSYVSTKFVQKNTLAGIRFPVAILLCVIALAMGAGMV